MSPVTEPGSSVLGIPMLPSLDKSQYQTPHLSPDKVPMRVPSNSLHLRKALHFHLRSVLRSRCLHLLSIKVHPDAQSLPVLHQRLPLHFLHTQSLSYRYPLQKHLWILLVYHPTGSVHFLTMFRVYLLSSVRIRPTGPMHKDRLQVNILYFLISCNRSWLYFSNSC